jgi:molecular chaperone DnaJ
MPKDYYEVLGVSKNASADDIKKAFRQAAVQHHPDKAKGEADKKAAEAKFKEINQAYDVLKDPQKKAAYDAYGHAAFEGGGPQGNPFAGAQGNPFAGFSGSFGGAEFNTEDIFDMFFNTGGRSRRRSSGPAKGHDLHYSITISFDQAVHGGQQKVELPHQAVCPTCNGSGAAKGSQPVTCDRCHGSGQVEQTSRSIFGQFTTAAPCPKCQGTGKIIPEPCPRCHGQGRVQQTEDLVIQIPAGADNGTELRFAGRGDAGANGAPAGDLYIEFQVQPHRYFKRRGNDIYLELPLSLSQAALGDTINVPTVDGTTKVKIPAGISNGTEIHLAGKGVPNLAGKGRGSQYLVARIEVPKKLSADQKKVLEQLQKVEAQPKLPWQ